MIDRNEHSGWQQGQFVYSSAYSKMSPDWIDRQTAAEKHLVRPSLTDSAICTVAKVEDAAWIAARLNLAARAQNIAKMLKRGVMSPMEARAAILTLAVDG